MFKPNPLDNCEKYESDIYYGEFNSELYEYLKINHFQKGFNFKFHRFGG